MTWYVSSVPNCHYAPQQFHDQANRCISTPSCEKRNTELITATDKITPSSELYLGTGVINTGNPKMQRN
jgi:hypothetical protein